MATNKKPKKKKKPNPHLVTTGSYSGVLSRNSTYREDAWNYLKGAVPNYSNAATALAAVIAQDNAMGRPGGRYKGGGLIGGKTQAQRAATYSISFFNPKAAAHNFKVGYIPYCNQAHHVLPCEVFYEKKWDAKHLDIVLDCGYDINNEKNIIYLPQCCGQNHLRDYHQLPDHSSGHAAYNKRVVGQADNVWDKADEALDAEECDKETLSNELLKMLQDIETANFNKLKSAGPTVMS